MSTLAIGNALSSFVQKTASGNNGQAAGGSSGQTSAAASALAEAQETAATTAKEAAHGDRQAIAKLARQQQQAALETPAKEPGKGDVVDHAA